MLPKKNGGRPSKQPSVDELAKMYEKMTAREIGEKLGVATSTVRTWIAKARKKENGVRDRDR